MTPVRHRDGCPLGDAWHRDYGKIRQCECPGSLRIDSKRQGEYQTEPGMVERLPNLDQYDRRLRAPKALRLDVKLI